MSDHMTKQTVEDVIDQGGDQTDDHVAECLWCGMYEEVSNHGYCQACDEDCYICHTCGKVKPVCQECGTCEECLDHPVMYHGSSSHLVCMTCKPDE